MIKDITISEAAASTLGAQLWRYYDIDACGAVQTGIEDYGDGLYRIFYEVESGLTYEFVKMRIYPHCVEDLYLVVGDEVLEPTTTAQEQEER